jgi:NADH dehydrogenase
MAGAIAEIAHKTMFKNFRRIRPEKSKIYLIELTSRILPPYPEKLSARAKKDLEKMGVSVLVNTKVLGVVKEGVQTDKGFIEAANIIWAAGNQASPLLKTLDVPLDRQGRVIVEKDLSIPGSPEIFVIGDAASVIGVDGKPLPAVAPVAIQQAKFVGWVIKKDLPKDLRPAFKYFDKGNLATIGKSKAVGFVGKIQFSGLIAWLGWCFIHIAYLIGFRNRISVMLEWFFFYISGQRGSRLIYHSIDEEIPKQKPF